MGKPAEGVLWIPFLMATSRVSLLKKDCFLIIYSQTITIYPVVGQIPFTGCVMVWVGISILPGG